MSGRKGGKIINNKDLDHLIKQGESSQRRRAEAIERRRKQAEEERKKEEMRKMMEDSGTVSQQKRGKGV